MGLFFVFLGFFSTSFSKSSHILDFHFYFTVGEKGVWGGESSHATHSSLAIAWNVVDPSNKVKTSNTVLYPWAAESLLPTEL